ncbi:MAG: type II toxin-antitoxin system RelE/ParE family toxin [Coriobacteriia bacterium]|jgi:putative addiction module killer protein|nr:type II toxin-antitoxin system RelE/ParE family toxin [Coriobacteriia bacterium]
MLTFEIRETDTYQRWFESLRDLSAQLRIAARIRRVSLGNLGDVKSVGDGVLELRVMCGPGYRVYLTRHGEIVIVLLAGGDKSTQQRDIERAKKLARGL